MEELSTKSERIKFTRNSYVFAKSRQYNCPTHGMITGTVTITMSQEEPEHYCIQCYKEIIKKYCCEVEPIN